MSTICERVPSSFVPSSLVLGLPSLPTATPRRVEGGTPIIVNLRRDPYEKGLITSNSYFDWMLDRAYMYVPAQSYVARFMETFKEFPPRQKAASFSLDQVMEKLTPPGG